MVWRDMVVGRDATLAEVQVAYSLGRYDYMLVFRGGRAR